MPTKRAGVEPYHENFERRNSKAGVDTHGRVVQNSPDISVLDLVERIDALDTIVEQLVEDEADTGSSGKFVK